ncbi:MAG: WG repeat-containing protein [Candidatus Wildermuthbacteria bacterium]|nr:WG repeat-containing protein [Candidatus Wildermuthbacteria bacterium]
MIPHSKLLGQYDFVDRFFEGLARVGKDGKQFHVRLDGTPAYEERYDCVSPFFSVEGLAWAREAGQWFHIRRDGKPAYPERYDSVAPFFQGRALVKKGGTYFRITPDGKPVE